MSPLAYLPKTVGQKLYLVTSLSEEEAKLVGRVGFDVCQYYVVRVGPCPVPEIDDSGPAVERVVFCPGRNCQGSTPFKVSDIDKVICSIKTIGLFCYTVPVRSQGGPADRAVIPIARDVRSIAVEGVPGDEAGIEIG